MAQSIITEKMVNKPKSAQVAEVSSNGWVWMADTFCPNRQWRACGECGLSLHLHNPTGKKLFGYCKECRKNFVI